MSISIVYDVSAYALLCQMLVSTAVFVLTATLPTTVTAVATPTRSLALGLLASAKIMHTPWIIAATAGKSRSKSAVLMGLHTQHAIGMGVYVAHVVLSSIGSGCGAGAERHDLLFVTDRMRLAWTVGAAAIACLAPVLLVIDIKHPTLPESRTQRLARKAVGVSLLMLLVLHPVDGALEGGQYNNMLCNEPDSGLLLAGRVVRALTFVLSHSVGQILQQHAEGPMTAHSPILGDPHGCLDATIRTSCGSLWALVTPTPAVPVVLFVLATMLVHRDRMRRLTPSAETSEHMPLCPDVPPAVDVETQRNLVPMSHAETALRRLSQLGVVSE